MLSAQAHQLTEKKEIDALNIDPKPHSYVYSFSADADLSSENLYHWFKKVREGEGEEYFKSQEAPFYRKYSKKLTGKTFQREVLMNDKDQAVFFYSKNCFACRQYGGVYEELGLEFLKQDRNIEFNRMNSDFNTLSCATNFPYTPVFQFYKKGAKEAPFVYRSDKFTPQLLKDFIEVSAEFKILPEEVFEKIYQNYQKIDLVEA
ncbi:Thioredoxin-like fold [Pseudocohnilembus persalinus]|uniref:Thioredoxin-like fold n=1 Tax=Pseudocohnilembus persalinus TaxID=266149 RepID=A0A0V0QJC1_PSEPJ|nr:Thioredoxin-like fold [Pseudocohnilembus persalinus]|eukprot:KRX02200.1 Thioredoxin-like fold [Pseudocohnilembus persalinus]